MDGDFAGSKEVINHEINCLHFQAMKRVLAVFFFLALGWIFRRDIELTNFIIPGWFYPTTRC
jgi:hypothetical protein